MRLSQLRLKVADPHKVGDDYRPRIWSARDKFMQEPLVAISSQEAGPDEVPRSFSEDEVVRLEKLLAARARETNALSRELERRSGLLREALERLSATASSELQALREARDAAVQRAIEAELARAELAFQLDETRGALHASGAASSSGPVGELRGLYSRIAQLEEADDAQRARLVLADQDRESAQARILLLERQLVEEGERFELSLLRARAEASSLIAESAARASAHVAEAEARTLRVRAESDARAEAQRASHAARIAEAEARVATSVSESAASATRQMDGGAALRGERDGLLARMLESESALSSVIERNESAARYSESQREKLAELRADAAQLAVAAQARSTRISELGLELAREQQEVRAVRAQLAASIAAHQAECSARESDVQGWMERLQQLERSRGQELPEHAAPAYPEQRWAIELRAFLATLREPLLQLKSALDDPGSASVPTGMAQAEAELGESTAPGTQYDAEVLAALEEKLRASESRVADLEATLAARAREAGLSALKGELIDTRADAARLSDDLIKERTRRRRLVVTARALQAAFESGEAPGPWIDELIALLNEGASVPPFGHG
jgi:hypothetical protein